MSDKDAAIRDVLRLARTAVKLFGMGGICKCVPIEAQKAIYSNLEAALDRAEQLED